MKAAAFALVGAVLTFFGFMHGEEIGFGESPGHGARYLGVARVLFACATLGRRRSRRPFPSTSSRNRSRRRSEVFALVPEGLSQFAGPRCPRQARG